MSNSDAEQHSAEIISRIAACVRDRYPLACGLILTGSAARNEATFLRDGAETLWLSDLEFLAVIPDSADAMRESGELSGLCRRIEHELKAKGTNVSIDIVPSSITRLSALGRNLFGYEFRVHGKLLFGERDYLEALPAFSWREIPKEDAWRLLSNRMVEWLDFETKRLSLSAAEQLYRLAKQYLDILTSITLFAECYSDRYETRVAALSTVEAWLERQMPELAVPTLRNGALLASHFKLHPGSPEYAWIRSCEPENFHGGLAAVGWSWMRDDLLRIHTALWDWELASLTGIEAGSAASSLAAVRKVYGRREQIRGWAKIVRYPQLRRGGTFFPRMIRLLPAGAPRALVFWCARQLADPAGCHGERATDAVKRYLPVIYAGGCDTREDVVSQCVRNWNSYLRR